MIRRAISILGILAVSFSSFSAMAAKKKVKEIYSATEGDAVQAVAVQAQKPSAPARAHKFDAVPQAQRDSLSKRLKIVEQLIVEHGRAYDYRIYTTSELEKILKELEQEVEEQGSDAGAFVPPADA